MLLAAPLYAERYALLVGVSQPKVGGAALSGPRHDVDAMRLRLLRYSFAPQHVQSLVDGEGTRDAVLEALREQVGRARAGDTLLFYFSGHGTSNYDGELGSELESSTGALIPFDAGTRKPLVSSLIVGERDLRGILSRLHPEATGIVIVDACYSEDAAKGAKSAAIRYWTPVEKHLGWRRLEQLARLSFAKAAEPYPYRNILTLAASARFQPAYDIAADQVRDGFRTVDGRPHGAMSNALFAGLDGRADANRDQQITYRQLFQFVQESVHAEFPQQPQYQYPSRAMLDEPVFGAPTLASPPQRLNGSGVPPVLLELAGANPELEAAVGRVVGVRVSMSRADYSLRAEVNGGYSLNQYPRGTEVAAFPGRALDAIEATLAAIAAARQLTSYRFASPYGVVSLEVEPGDQASYYDGQRFEVHGRSSEPGVALLLSVDATGHVDVLYPLSGEPTLPAGKTVRLLGARVGAPYGISTLKLFVFSKAPAGLERFYCMSKSGGTECPSFSATSERFQTLMRLLNSYDGAGAEYQFKIDSRP